MKFSVLLPTRNGGDFLNNCILSILEQDFDDFELIISDNANSDGTKDIIRSFLSDGRVKVVTQDSILSVSENWTAALQASDGDYVLMMGDDDYLLQGSLSRLNEALRDHDNPDCIIYNGYSYVTPMAISGNEASLWSKEHFKFGTDFDNEMVIEPQKRMDIVYDMFRFKTRIPLNMQTTLFSRRSIKDECNDEFKAPFPDHYLLNALLIKAHKWVYLPDKLVVIGVSPKSFGHYFYSQNANDGLNYLGINTDFPEALPGSELLNGMASWLHELKRQYPEQLKNIDMDWGGYVRRQVYTWALQHRYGGLTSKDILIRFSKLSVVNWLHLLMTIFDFESWKRLFRLVKPSKISQAEMLWEGLLPLPDIKDIRGFSEWLKKSKDDFG